MKRSLEQVEKIRLHQNAPFQVDDFLSPSEIQKIKSDFDQSEIKEFKSTGPVCAPYIPHPNLDQKIHSLLGPCQILSTSLYFSTTVPHVLHMDAPQDLSVAPFKAVLLPLHFEGPASCPQFDLSFFTFHQRWFGEPAKFFKGEQDVYSPHNRPIYSYEDVEGLVLDQTISEEFRLRWFPHLKSTWLEGLSIDHQFDWKVGSAIVFDSVQIHCSSDFRKAGVNSKLGLTVFTGLL